MKNKEDAESKEKAKDMEADLAEKYAEGIFNQIKDEIKNIKHEEGGLNSGNLWRLKNKINKKYPEPPTAMRDSKGNLLTGKRDILEETVKHYEKVLKNRPIKEELKGYQKEREDLASARMKMASQNKTDDWTMDDLDKVLTGLKSNKSRDALGYLNELFKPKVIGSDLKLAILKLMNRIKQTQEYPKCLELCNITSIFKRKGSINDFSQYRGIFRVLVFRSILERLIYNDEYYTIDDNLTDANVGARKHRNIRDNLFVVNAVLNSIKRGSEEAVDLCTYDVEKCFDALWTYECVNDLYESGLKNDKLTLLFKMNQSAQVAIKTAHGITQRVNISNVIMQGTVWGSLFCATTMDKLAKLAYQNRELLYQYKGKVDVPPLEMVDDILTVQKCGATSSAINAEVNAFIEQKKLTLGLKKCTKMHIGSKCNDCSQLFVHEEEMAEAHEVKYLGDIIHENGRPKATILKRVNQGYAIVGQIFALLKDLPIGNLRVQIGLELRQAWLINGVLFNSEVWHSVADSDIAHFVEIDKYLLRGLVQSHAKVPIEHLYLETAAIPIPFIISARRLIYLQTILQRSDHEITKNIYKHQKTDPSPGDWCHLVNNDFNVIGEHMSETQIEAMCPSEFKKYIKSKVRNAAFQHLNEIKSGHSKVRENIYSNLEKPQEYLTSELFSNQQCSLIFALKSKTLRGVKSNFKSMNPDNYLCPLCERYPDTQQHLSQCKILQDILPHIGPIDYSGLSGNVHQQQEFIVKYEKYLVLRDELLSDDPDTQSSLPGLHTGPQLRQARISAGSGASNPT